MPKVTDLFLDIALGTVLVMARRKSRGQENRKTSNVEGRTGNRFGPPQHGDPIPLCERPVNQFLSQRLTGRATDLFPPSMTSPAPEGLPPTTFDGGITPNQVLKQIHGGKEK